MVLNLKYTAERGGILINNFCFVLYTAGMMFCNFFRKRYYFDSGSFTPVHRKACAIMKCVFDVQTKCGLGNPAAAHQSGQNAKQYLEQARTIVARCCQIKADNVLFTSGATEANFLALRTAVLHARLRGIDLTDMHIIVGNEEHDSVYRNVSYFQMLGVRHTVVSPGDGRRFTPKDVRKHIRKDTVALSLQLVNSRHGVVQPIADISGACRAACPSVFIHTDAAQGTAYFNCSPVSLGADAVTVDSAKSFGPQGAGALLFRQSRMYAGLQGEHSLWDLRPGTPSVALMYGFATALDETRKCLKENYARALHARNYTVGQLTVFFPEAVAEGIDKALKDVRASDWKKVAPHLLYLSFPDTNHAYLATLLDANGFAVSTGSACAGLTKASLRIGVLPSTTEREVRALVRCLRKQLPIARSL